MSPLCHTLIVMATLLSLPTVITKYILLCFDGPDLLNACNSSKRISDMCDDAFWQDKLIRDYNISNYPIKKRIKSCAVLPKKVNTKKLYIKMMEVDKYICEKGVDHDLGHSHIHDHVHDHVMIWLSTTHALIMRIYKNNNHYIIHSAYTSEEFCLYASKFMGVIDCVNVNRVAKLLYQLSEDGIKYDIVSDQSVIESVMKTSNRYVNTYYGVSGPC